MKKLVLALVACLGLAGCAAEGTAYAQAPVYSGTVRVCDSWGCRYVSSNYYYDNAGYLFYYDTGLGVYMSPGYGYWHGGHFFHGYHPGYYGHYYGGAGYHGSYHGGGGSFHGGGGHGGHH